MCKSQCSTKEQEKSQESLSPVEMTDYTVTGSVTTPALKMMITNTFKDDNR